MKFKKIACILIGILFMFTNINSLKAASASISVSSSKSTVLVGGTFSVTVKLSSATTLGTWEWSIDYDKTRFKYISGETPVIGYGDGVKKSVSYTYQFKAIASGNGRIGIKSYSALDWTTKSNYSLSVGSKTVSVITQAQLEATYSKNNNLSSLSIDGYTLSPSFNKGVTSYTASGGANVEKINVRATREDSKSSISGAGTRDVAEGDNKIDITVTAQNGAVKTYTITFTVIDNNPIEVTVDGKKLVVVKRASKLVAPSNYEYKEIKINDQTIPSYYSDINKYYLVGLRDSDSIVKLYIYNESDKSYTLYSETKFNQSLLQPLVMDKTFDENYTKTNIKINESTFESYAIPNTTYSIIRARDISTGKDDYYIYDSKTKTVVSYDSKLIQEYKNKSEKYYTIILLLTGETALVFIILIIVLINKLIKNNRKKKTLKEQSKRKNEENIEEDTKAIEEENIINLVDTINNKGNEKEIAKEEKTKKKSSKKSNNKKNNIEEKEV